MTNEQLGAIGTIVSGALVVVVLALIAFHCESSWGLVLALACAVVAWAGNLALTTGKDALTAVAFSVSILLAAASFVASLLA